MSNNTEQSITKNRFISFIDIMGFKELVSREPHEDVYNMLLGISEIREYIEKTIKKFKKDNESKVDISTASFSDSIILFTEDDSLESFDLIIFATSWLFAKAIEKSIPMKGALSHGQLSVNTKKQIYFGQPLIDSYLLEEELWYYGIVCHHSILSFIQNQGEPPNASHYLFESPTPLKSGLINHTNIDWFRDLEIRETIEGKEKLNRDFRKAFDIKITSLTTKTSGSPRKYIDNTISVFNTKYPSDKS